MSQSDASSQLSSGPPSPAHAPAHVPVSPDHQPHANRFDTMFGSDGEDAESPDKDDASDEDEENAGTRKRVVRVAAEEDAVKEEVDDLFGEDDDEELKKPEHVDDEEMDEDEREATPQKDETYLDVQIPRHPGPQPGPDGELYLLKTANITMEPRLFIPEKFELPKATTGHSAYTSATSAIRIRQSPADPTTLQSNARIIRWSDGTLSLQVASSPNLYDLPSKPLAPAPTSNKYDPAADSHTYLLDPMLSAGFLRVCGHATSSLGCQPAAGSVANDTAVERLQERLKNPALQKQRTREMSELIDPEAQRKTQEAIARQRDRDNRKRESLRRKREDREPIGGIAGAGSAADRRWRGSGTRTKRESPPILTGRGRGKEDEYDLEDGFIEGSDEEEEQPDEESEEEEEEEEVWERKPKAGRGEERAGKRRRIVDESDDEEE